jgi:hypothetical protein
MIISIGGSEKTIEYAMAAECVGASSSVHLATDSLSTFE